MIIVSGRLGRDNEIKEVMAAASGRPYKVLNNCIFVHNKDQQKDVPINITAWGDNAKFIQDNFCKGDSIQIVAQETPHDRKSGEKEYIECVYTVRKVLDWSMYINTVKFLSNTLSRIENSCSERNQEQHSSAEEVESEFDDEQEIEK